MVEKKGGKSTSAEKCVRTKKQTKNTSELNATESKDSGIKESEDGSGSSATHEEKNSKEHDNINFIKNDDKNIIKDEEEEDNILPDNQPKKGNGDISLFDDTKTVCVSNTNHKDVILIEEDNCTKEDGKVVENNMDNKHSNIGNEDCKSSEHFTLESEKVMQINTKKNKEMGSIKQINNDMNLLLDTDKIIAEDEDNDKNAELKNPSYDEKKEFIYKCKNVISTDENYVELKNRHIKASKERNTKKKVKEKQEKTTINNIDVSTGKELMGVISKSINKPRKVIDQMDHNTNIENIGVKINKKELNNAKPGINIYKITKGIDLFDNPLKEVDVRDKQSLKSSTNKNTVISCEMETDLEIQTKEPENCETLRNYIINMEQEENKLLQMKEKRNKQIINNISLDEKGANKIVKNNDLSFISDQCGLSDEIKREREVFNTNYPMTSSLKKKTEEFIDNNKVPVYEEFTPDGRYGRLSTVIGHGAQKIVYKGMDTTTNEEIAWCVIDEKDMLKNNEKQLEMIKNIDHPNIIKTHMYYYKTPHEISKKEMKKRHLKDNLRRECVVITELCLGGSLREHIDFIGHKNISIGYIKKWAYEILKALEYLHELNVVHRDIKCDNIFFEPETHSVKIGDLGISRHCMSKRYTMIGTPEYMAREVFDGDGYGSKVDLYAFGMAVLEMATGEYPYSECSTPHDVFTRIMNGVPPHSLFSVSNACLVDLILRSTDTVNIRHSAKDALKHHLFINNRPVIKRDRKGNWYRVLDKLQPLDLSMFELDNINTDDECSEEFYTEDELLIDEHNYVISDIDLKTGKSRNLLMIKDVTSLNKNDQVVNGPIGFATTGCHDCIEFLSTFSFPACNSHNETALSLFGYGTGKLDLQLFYKEADHYIKFQFDVLKENTETLLRDMEIEGLVNEANINQMKKVLNDGLKTIKEKLRSKDDISDIIKNWAFEGFDKNVCPGCVAKVINIDREEDNYISIINKSEFCNNTEKNEDSKINVGKEEEIFKFVKAHRSHNGIEHEDIKNNNHRKSNISYKKCRACLEEEHSDSIKGNNGINDSEHNIIKDKELSEVHLYNKDNINIEDICRICNDLSNYQNNSNISENNIPIRDFQNIFCDECKIYGTMNDHRGVDVNHDNILENGFDSSNNKKDNTNISALHSKEQKVIFICQHGMKIHRQKDTYSNNGKNENNSGVNNNLLPDIDLCIEKINCACKNKHYKDNIDENISSIENNINELTLNNVIQKNGDASRCNNDSGQSENMMDEKQGNDHASKYNDVEQTECNMDARQWNDYSFTCSDGVGQYEYVLDQKNGNGNVSECDGLEQSKCKMTEKQNYAHDFKVCNGNGDNKTECKMTEKQNYANDFKVCNGNGDNKTECKMNEKQNYAKDFKACNGNGEHITECKMNEKQNYAKDFKACNGNGEHITECKMNEKQALQTMITKKEILKPNKNSKTCQNKCSSQPIINYEQRKAAVFESKGSNSLIIIENEHQRTVEKEQLYKFTNENNNSNALNKDRNDKNNNFCGECNNRKEYKENNNSRNEIIREETNNLEIINNDASYSRNDENIVESADKLANNKNVGKDLEDYHPILNTKLIKSDNSTNQIVSSPGIEDFKCKELEIDNNVYSFNSPTQEILSTSSIIENDRPKSAVYTSTINLNTSPKNENNRPVSAIYNSTSQNNLEYPLTPTFSEIEFPKKIFNDEMPIEEFIKETAFITKRDTQTIKEWSKALKEQEIESVGELKILVEEDWDHLGLTVFGSRAMKNILYGKDKQPLKEKEMTNNSYITINEEMFTMSIEEFFETKLKPIINRPCDEWINKILRQDVRNLMELKCLTESDWERLELSTLAYRIIRNVLFRKGKITSDGKII